MDNPRDREVRSPLDEVPPTPQAWERPEQVPWRGPSDPTSRSRERTPRSRRGSGVRLRRRLDFARCLQQEEDVRDKMSTPMTPGLSPVLGPADGNHDSKVPRRRAGDPLWPSRGKEQISRDRTPRPSGRDAGPSRRRTPGSRPPTIGRKMPELGRVSSDLYTSAAVLSHRPPRHTVFLSASSHLSASPVAQGLGTRLTRRWTSSRARSETDLSSARPRGTPGWSRREGCLSLATLRRYPTRTPLTPFRPFPTHGTGKEVPHECERKVREKKEKKEGGKVVR